VTGCAHGKRQEVVEFLTSFKTAMGFGWFHFKNRQRNLQGLVDLGLSVDGAKEILAQLGVENYASGPEPEHDDPSRDVWIFGYELDGKEIYIKLRLAPDTRNKELSRAVVWSFHRAERALRYPLRGE
jgi:hypothetical protein